eukprot:11634413-Alexandrium_andersonii.AAC.1
MSASGKSWGVVFLDLSSAFDTVLRQCVLPMVPSSEVGPSLMALGLSQQVAQPLHDAYQQKGSLIEALGVDARAAQLLASTHRQAWVDQSDTQCR